MASTESLTKFKSFILALIVGAMFIKSKISMGNMGQSIQEWKTVFNLLNLSYVVRIFNVNESSKTFSHVKLVLFSQVKHKNSF